MGLEAVRLRIADCGLWIGKVSLTVREPNEIRPAAIAKDLERPRRTKRA
jgi:hypothetical protein